MARPRLTIGTYGEIRTYKLGPKRWRAITSYRDYDGKLRPVERHGSNKARAVAALKEALRDRARIDASVEITPDTKLSALAELWYAEITQEVEEGLKSPNTARQYRERLDNQIIPALGDLLLREITVSRVDAVVKDTKKNHGHATAKMVRTVLSGLLGLATRHDVYDHNPAREVRKIASKKSAAEALTLEQALDLRAKIAADPKAIEWDLVDFTDLMLATGLRIGEASAVTVDALDLDEGTVEVRGTVIRVKGVGLIIKPKPKGKCGYRTLELSSWAVDMLKARLDGMKPNRWGVIFTAPLGGLRDPSNTMADLRVVFAAAGYGWVTSHIYRKTVATLMDEAGCSPRQAADQLGHAKISMTQDNYFRRKTIHTGAAAALEPIGHAQ